MSETAPPNYSAFNLNDLVEHAVRLGAKRQVAEKMMREKLQSWCYTLWYMKQERTG